MARVAETMGVEVEFIEKRDFLKLAEFDALFIRETTAIDDHTYRFATRAEWEGMPVIDDPTSILRCTNKVYLAELLKANKVPTPKTIVVDGVRNIERLEDELPYPIVLKIPDGSFSRGVYKAKDRRELSQMAEALLDESDLILAQEYMYTDFDWRVGVLDGEPLFVSQYLMAKKHWQIVKHDADGKVLQGNFKTIALEDAPPAVVDAGVRAARLIGKGLYGVDLKQNDKGVFVIEVNDNPNLDAGVEDAVTKDELWRRLIRWFTSRLD
jgi:glutathione synthase/RimK-type ligase-like ATP-grasp enzyme